MKEKYLKPEVELIDLSCAEIVTENSPEDPGDHDVDPFEIWPEEGE